jgi:hypothetical protein
MTTITVVRYTTKDDAADDNADLIRDVFAELNAQQTDGIRYAAFRLDDGVSFLHVAVLDGEQNPLTTSPAFHAFQAGIADRCIDGPRPASATLVGSHGLGCPG